MFHKFFSAVHAHSHNKSVISLSEELSQKNISPHLLQRLTFKNPSEEEQFFYTLLKFFRKKGVYITLHENIIQYQHTYTVIIGTGEDARSLIFTKEFPTAPLICRQDLTNIPYLQEIAEVYSEITKSIFPTVPTACYFFQEKIDRILFDIQGEMTLTLKGWKEDYLSYLWATHSLVTTIVNYPQLSFEEFKEKKKNTKTLLTRSPKKTIDNENDYTKQYYQELYLELKTTLHTTESAQYLRSCADQLAKYPQHPDASYTDQQGVIRNQFFPLPLSWKSLIRKAYTRAGTIYSIYERYDQAGYAFSDAGDWNRARYYFLKHAHQISGKRLTSEEQQEKEKYLLFGGEVL